MDKMSASRGAMCARCAPRPRASCPAACSTASATRPFAIFSPTSASHNPSHPEMKRLLSMVLLAAPLAAVADDLKLGIIGLDTSHVTAFTEILNNPNAAGHVPGGKVVAAFKSSSADIPSSADRVEEYTAKLQKDYGVKLVGSIEELCREVDGV